MDDLVKNMYYLVNGFTGYFPLANRASVSSSVLRRAWGADSGRDYG